MSGRSWFRTLVWTVALLPALVLSIASVVLAFSFPLELELREGTSWLHVMALKAGVPIYDHRQVAFLNMNHGPLDPFLKYLISSALPVLAPSMVTRLFVMLLPVGLYAALAMVFRKKGMVAGGWTAGLFLFLLGLQPPYFLIGRSDPAALFFLCLMQCSALVNAETPESPMIRRAFWRRMVTGILGSFVILTNWRLFPAVGVIGIGFAIEGAVAAKAGRRMACLIHYLGALFCGLALPFLAVLIGIFHGNIGRYYQHFFGFFKEESGWGALTEGVFEVFPAGLMFSRWLVHGSILAVAALALFLPAPAVPRKIQLCVWIPLLVLLWLTVAAAYYFNRSGGGIYYFGVCYIIITVYLARSVDWSRVNYPCSKEIVLAVFVCGLPWKVVGLQTTRLWESLLPAWDFIAETRRMTGGAFVHSEAYYFFKHQYGGEVVDMADVVSKVRLTGYFGGEFTATANRYFDDLKSRPPAFVMAGIGSPEMTELLRHSYDPILTAPPHLWPYMGPTATLYRMRHDEKNVVTELELKRDFNPK